MDGKVGVWIGRVTSNTEGAFISIEIQDEASRIRIVEVKMTLEEFAQCVTGMSLMDIPAEFGDLSLIGKQMEVKVIEISGLDYSTWKDRNRFIKPFEADGWKAEDKEEMNHHRMSKNGYQVTFRRWV